MSLDEKFLKSGRSYRTVQEAEDFIQSHEVSTNTRYSNYAKDDGFNKEEINLEHHKPLFADIKREGIETQILFTGIPFVILGKKRLYCTHGKDLCSSTKKKRLDQKIRSGLGDHAFGRTHFLQQDTKKMDCPAEIIMRDVVFFPEFKIDTDTRKRRQTASKKLKEAWKDHKSNPLQYERRILVKLHDNHSGHITNEVFGGISQQVDKRIVSRGQHLVGEGVWNIQEIQRDLNRYVREELFSHSEVPSISNRRFFPTTKDIRNIRNRTRSKLRKSKIDQENLFHKINEWKRQSPRDLIYFRCYGKSPEILETKPFYNENGELIGEENSGDKSSQSLLFVHQTVHQQRLLEKYGNSICLLDATYKTTRYALPLFFLATKTNVDYQIVASFCIQEETTVAIKEALGIVSKWNPLWQPTCFMVDNCEEEIKSISQLFQQTRVLLCDFHREQAWHRWLSASNNSMVLHKTAVLAMLRRIACSETVDEYRQNCKAMKNSEVWNLEKSKSFRNWIEKTWLPVHQYWVRAYRIGILEVVVNTNNGVERKNRDFKHQYLSKFNDKSLSGMITVLVEHFLPDKYKSYVESNIRACDLYRKYNNALPCWLHNRPKKYVSLCMDRIASSQGILQDDIVVLDDYGKFLVRSSTEPNRFYEINFGNDFELPSCECESWKRHYVPCKHMMAIFEKCDNFSWKNISVLYRKSPFFNLDSDIVKIEATRNTSTEEISDSCPEICEDNFDNSHSLIPLPVKSCQTDASFCRELLNRIRSITYLVHEKDAFARLKEQLMESLNEISEKAKHDHGLVLQNPPKKTYQKKNLHFSRLPKPRPRQVASGRIGAKAEKAKESSKIVVGKSQRITIVEEEIVGIDLPDSENIDSAEFSSDEDTVFDDRVYSDGFVSEDSFDEHTADDLQLQIVHSIQSNDWTETLLKNGCHSLTFMDLLSLEVHHSSFQLAEIKKIDRSFKTGWLHDEIINSFCYHLSNIHSNVLYCGSTEALLISSGKSFRNLWKGVNLHEKDLVLIPFNHTGNHWILITLTVKSGSLSVIDPMRCEPTEITMQKSRAMVENIMQKKFNSRNLKVVKRPHFLQSDAISCGVLTCYYAEQSAQGKSLETAINLTAYRKRIYEEVVGFCIKEASYSKNICKICRNDGDESWVCCCRCGQWFHCSCVNINLLDAKKTKFCCPA